MSAKPPVTAAIARLAPCPRRPNCVSSLAADSLHRVEPLPILGTPQQSLQRLREIIESMRRSTVDEAAEGYLEARFRSRLFRFTDDLQLAVDPAAGVIHVRSAARLGLSDHGVNRARVEAIRRRYLATE